MIDAVIGRSVSADQDEKGTIKIVLVNELDGTKDWTTLSLNPNLVSLNDGSLDLLLVARGLLWLEERLRRGKSPVRVTLSVEDPTIWSGGDSHLVPLLRWLLRRDFVVRIRARPRLPVASETTEGRAVSLALYSGGVDSTSGLLWSKVTGKSRAALFVNHQPMLGSWIGSEGSRLLDDAGIPLKTIATSRTSEQILQLRGLLYAVAGMVVSSHSGCDVLDINECGVTMYQPPLLSNDIVTVTTNPRLLKAAQALVRLVIRKSIEIREPFENLTKAEVIAISGLPSICKSSRSCISSRFVNAERAAPECGHCWGCVIKKVGAVASRADPYETAVDVLTQNIGDRANRGEYQTVTENSLHNLALLIDFATRALSRSLPWWTSVQIEKYRKGDLFQRFALDTFVAFHLAHRGRRGGTINRLVEQSYTDVIKSGLLSKEKLEDRIGRLGEMRSRGVHPRFLSLH